ncbi:MAG: hypothetical protein ABI863_07905 [Ginsengibacter sp.]
MQKITFFLTAIKFIFVNRSCFGQKYTMGVAGTIELDDEYAKLTNNAADLSFKLIIRQIKTSKNIQLNHPVILL